MHVFARCVNKPLHGFSPPASAVDVQSLLMSILLDMPVCDPRFNFVELLVEALIPHNVYFQILIGAWSCQKLTYVGSVYSTCVCDIRYASLCHCLEFK